MTKKNNKQNYYYSEEQEQAVIDFLNTDDPLEREKIYRNYLKEPLDKMVESIIRKYKLHRENYTFDELHTDCLSHLMTKFHHFKPEQGKKSYSYFGTIIRHYLYNEMVKQHKRGNRQVPYEDISTSLEERPDLTYTMDEEVNIDYRKFMSKLADNIRDEIDQEGITNNEYKVGDTLITILEEWETIFGKDNKGRSQFNKKLVLQILRNRTNLTTKQIRDVMKKRFKQLYKNFKIGYE